MAWEARKFNAWTNSDMFLQFGAAGYDRLTKEMPKRKVTFLSYLSNCHPLVADTTSKNFE
jgi:hypothetical protein